jgi:hypothetical protein
VMEANKRRLNESPAAKKWNAIQEERLQKMMAEVVDCIPDGHGGTAVTP